MNRKRLLCHMMAALLLFSSCLTAPAAEPAGEQPEVLRVGFYGYEFLQRLAINGGWSYEYVGYDGSYAEALDMLRSGEVDIVTSVSRTPQREEEFLFSDQDIGVNSTYFFRKQ